jgi:hypothetical protein
LERALSQLKASWRRPKARIRRRIGGRNVEPPAADWKQRVPRAGEWRGRRVAAGLTTSTRPGSSRLRGARTQTARAQDPPVRPVGLSLPEPTLGRSGPLDVPQLKIVRLERERQNGLVLGRQPVSELNDATANDIQPNVALMGTCFAARR